jgi:prepilin-type processing-associated H-X9-DG protein
MDIGYAVPSQIVKPSKIGIFTDSNGSYLGVGSIRGWPKSTLSFEAWHQWKCNVAFLDGHCETLPYAVVNSKLLWYKTWWQYN